MLIADDLSARLSSILLIVDGNSFDDHKGSIRSLTMSMSASISAHALIVSWSLDAALNLRMVVEKKTAAKSCRLLRRLCDALFMW